MILSVVIPAHGRSDLLIRCLKSLGRNTDINFEVCVVDDGSGLDENEIRTESSMSYPLIWRSFVTQRGRSAARNEGIKSTSGEIIVFLDSDMEARNGFLEAHLKSHREHPHTLAIGKIIWPKGGSFLRYVGTRGVTKLKGDNTVPPWYFTTNNASIERNDLSTNSPFDETLTKWGGEDLDLGMKLYAAGVKFTFAPDAVTFHNFDVDLRTHVTRTYLYGCNTLPVLVSRYPEILRITKLHLLESVMWRFLVKKPIFYPILFFTNIFDALPLPAKLFDYLTFAAYARGWMERKQI